MRVRVTRSVDACIDGIQLDYLIVGHEYELSVPVACYLMAIEAVEPVPDESTIWVSPATADEETSSNAVSKKTRGREIGSSGARLKKPR